jgi:hypothetical protein
LQHAEENVGGDFLGLFGKLQVESCIMTAGIVPTFGVPAKCGQADEE